MYVDLALDSLSAAATLKRWVADYGCSRASLGKDRFSLFIYHAWKRPLKVKQVRGRRMNQNHNNNRRKVLVVDDDPIIRDMMVAILDFAGYATIPARLGLEALELRRGCDPYLI